MSPLELYERLVASTRTELATLRDLTGVAASANVRSMAWTVLKACGILVVGALLGGVAIAALDTGASDPGLQTAKQASPDTPPAEFAYLDSGRVLAYLGQIEGGLAATQTRTRSAKTTTKAPLTAKDVAAAEASSEKLRGSSETVTLTEADRFYTLLRILRKNQAADGEKAFTTLVDIDAAITGQNTVDKIRDRLKKVEENDFVRILNVHAFIPTYAAILPRARFASYYLGGALKEPTTALYAPVSLRAHRAVERYKAALQGDPRIPVVVPTLSSGRSKLRHVVTFFIPARYRSLSREASLLGGELTVVGKVVYKDPRLPDDAPEEAPTGPSYLDRETLTTFAPALQRAEGLLLTRLKLDRNRILDQVRRSLTIASPVAVVIPVAIYQ